MANTPTVQSRYQWQTSSDILPEGYPTDKEKQPATEIPMVAGSLLLLAGEESNEIT